MGARFVRLGIAGFKSFADATSVEILPGLTGVVGPNGCGKSNVAEALRWAMGEANARHLRGGEMDDIIFAGTAHRPSRNLAEVSLTVEDDEAGLPHPFTGQAEVQVVRRLERGTGSSYRVNGREARARDVQTLFADLASGARSTAMVSQGRVGTLVNARPEDRRSVLEEAAGITGLHARRAEAETRLRAAETNLERADDRRLGLEQQLSRLAGQAKQAARYRTVMTAVLEAEAVFLSIQQARAAAAVQMTEAALVEATDAVSRGDAAAATTAERAGEMERGLPERREAESRARIELERARSARDQLAAELARGRAALASAEQRRVQIARDLAHAQSVLKDAEGASLRLDAETAQLLVESAEHPAALVAAEAEAAAAAAALVAADQIASEAGAAASEVVARMEAARQALKQAESRHRRSEEAHARLTADRARAAAQMVPADKLASADEALATAETALTGMQAELQAAESTRTRTTPAAQAARDAFATAEAARHRLAAETAALREVLGVSDGEKWPPMVDALTVAPGLETALGAVLGEELAAAADPAAARHWRLMPDIPAPALQWPALAESVKGPASLDRALSAIGLVDSEAEGDAAHAALSFGQCLVSRTGAVWRWDGYTVRAGTRSAAAIRLEQRNRLSGLSNRLLEAEVSATAARVSRDAADAADREAVAAAQRLRTALSGAEAMRERARADSQSLHRQADMATARLASIEEQLAQVGPEYEEASVALSTARQESAQLPDPLVLRQAADAARVAVTESRRRDATATRALDLLSRAEQVRQARLTTIDREREDRQMRHTDLLGRVADLEARGTEAVQLLEELTKQLRETGAVVRSEDEVRMAERLLTVATTALHGAERHAAEARVAARATEHAVFAARETLVRAESSLAAAKEAQRAVLLRVAEREAALPPFPSPPGLSLAEEDRARSRLLRLTRERDEIGPVNLQAEAEAAEMEAAVTTIERERGELSTAIAKLRGSIGHLNREGRERLSSVFQQVDRHFQALFGRMFGGGRAHLALVGSDDPLEAGLEIFAQPPGKKLSALSLLSGGEQALTALSLIFAVFRCNPAPLCVLDEVDAPLDDANVERFCALLSDMAQETGTRFLVVTHHQVTMSRMDRLYGVTMQERGVSSVLSVDLSHAMGLVEAIAAE